MYSRPRNGRTLISREVKRSHPSSAASLKYRVDRMFQCSLFSSMLSVCLKVARGHVVTPWDDRRHVELLYRYYYEDSFGCNIVASHDVSRR